MGSEGSAANEGPSSTSSGGAGLSGFWSVTAHGSGSSSGELFGVKGTSARFGTAESVDSWAGDATAGAS